jgi:type II secretory pathway pseudopilin PulG
MEAVVNRPHSVTGIFPRNQSGFSLIEAMLALMLLTLGCAAVAGLFMLADRAMAQAAHYDDAVGLVRQMIELKRMEPFEALLAGGHQGDEVIGPFHRRWRLQVNRPAPGLATLSVDVDWRDATDRPRRLQAALIRADRRAAE